MQITFLLANGDEVEARVESGSTILDAARARGVPIESPCGGNGTCGKCGVTLMGEAVLACRTIARDGMRVVLHASCDAISAETAGEAFAYAIDDGAEEGEIGVAIDIGTTTIATELVSLATGETIASGGALNPQAEFAHDVLGRIGFGSTAEGLEALRLALERAVAKLLREMAGEKKVSDAVVSGNAAMLCIAAGADPSSLGSFPYECKLTGGEYTKTNFGLVCGLEAYLPPIVSAFVGADIVCGIIAAHLAKKRGVTLFIDIGTNGEMVLAEGGELVATATAAGPAFEGMNISCGMRATSGAVERFHIDDDGASRFETIGGAKPIGICGSGLLDAVAEFVRVGSIEPSGRLASGARELRAADGVSLTQADVRQVQLAKAAIRAGVDALLLSLRVEREQVDEVLIAGSFGFHLSEASLIGIGMIPREFSGKVRFVGNTSLAGAKALLLNHALRSEAESVARRVKVINLSEFEGFEDLYVSSMGFLCN